MKVNLQRHNFFHYLATIFVYLLKGIIGELMWVLIGLGGYFIFQSKRSPFDVIIGLPLITVSIGFIVNSIWSELLAIFSPDYNRGVCVICKM